MRTKEDYVLWLKIAKKGIILYGIDKVLTYWQKSPKSLSSSSIQKILDAFKVYKNYENFGIIKSFYKTIILSLNYLRKKYGILY